MAPLVPKFSVAAQRPTTHEVFTFRTSGSPEPDDGLGILQDILRDQGVEAHSIVSTPGSFGKRVYWVNETLQVRVSEDSMSKELAHLERVSDLPLVPRVRHSGTLGPWYYLILDHLPGADLASCLRDLSDEDQHRLGNQASEFLSRLHQKRGDAYDLGLFVPRIVSFRGSWLQAHRLFWRQLRTFWDGLDLGQSLRDLAVQSFDSFDAYEECLLPTTGPVLLHNDFHPKNLIVQERLSGVIDWECSQYGEPDFDLRPLVRWTAFPPQPGSDVRAFTQAVLLDQLAQGSSLLLARRLTIYELEHELCEVLWNRPRNPGALEHRWRYWLSGGVERLFEELGLG